MKVTRASIAILSYFLIFACNGAKNENNRHIISDNYDGVNSKEAKSYLVLGDKEHINENYTLALEHFQKANSIEPNNPLILNSLANVEFVLGKKELSFSHFEKSISLDTTFLSAYASYGTCLEKSEHYTKAIRVLKKGFRQSNEDQFVHYGLAFNLAINYYKIDSCDLAMDYIKIALKNKFKNEHFDTETKKTVKIISNCND